MGKRKTVWDALTALAQDATEKAITRRRDIQPRMTRRPFSPKEVELYSGRSKRCVKCGEVKDILQEFGLRTQGADDPRDEQSYCRACRAASVPRKRR